MENQSMTTGQALDQESMESLNQEGAAQVAAITPTSDPLSDADQQLLMKVAMGGAMQLEVSEAALDVVEDDDVMALAEAEVEEQTGIASKLEEIAAAKGIELSDEADPQTEDVLDGLETAGEDADAYYVRTSGVEGHQKLHETMTMVRSQAQDPALLALAEAALPVIEAHLQAAQQLLGTLGEDASMN